MTPTPPPPAPLDFAKVRQQCPAAFAALIAWFSADKYTIHGTVAADSPSESDGGYGPWLELGPNQLEFGDYRHNYTMHPRDLYDFFDQSGVFVVIQHTGTTLEPFLYELESAGTLEGSSVCYPTRVEAEAAAFGAAFWKLEEMLKQEK